MSEPTDALSAVTREAMALRVELDQARESLVELQSAYAVANKRLVDAAERQRQRDHHDIFRDVLKEMIRAATARRLAGNPPLNQNFDDTMAGLVEIARRHADLAYPPPKS